MRRIKKSIVVATALFFSMTMIQTNVDAASKKLKVNTVYDTTTKVKGKTKKRYKVKLKVGKKTYIAKANKKGNFQIRIPKQNPGKKIKIKVYRRKNKKWKLYTKKTVTVKKKSKKVVTNTTKKNKYPGKEDPIDLEQVNKDIATGKKMFKGETALGPGHYYYTINYAGIKGTAKIGYVNDYINVHTDGEYVTLKPLNGATLYYTVAGASEKAMSQLEEPTFASEQLKPGQKVVFSCYDFNRKTVNHGGLYLKVKAYKNGKLIAVSYDDHYMIYMPPGYHY
ncbi:hypothetical protein DW246_08780 [Lachnospiraceae bacterium AM21-21]|nr:hypothetical protein DW246_08780 [Lachnospiraceae bacterium AM21-21]